MHFSVAVVLCDREMQSTTPPMNSKGQGHVVAKGYNTVQRTFFSETNGPISLNFICSLKTREKKSLYIWSRLRPRYLRHINGESQ